MTHFGSKQITQNQISRYLSKSHIASYDADDNVAPPLLNMDAGTFRYIQNQITGRNKSKPIFKLFNRELALCPHIEV